MFWIMLGCLAAAMLIHLLDSPRVRLSPHATAWQQVRANGIEFVGKLSALIGIGLAAVLVLRATGALAQPETPEVAEYAEVFVPLGYTEVLRFQTPIETVRVVNKGAIEAGALTDRSISITGIGIGSTILLVYAADGRTLYNARVTVAASEPGHRVNVHAKPAGHEYWAYYCTGTRCARIKDELEGAPPDSRVSRSTTIYVPGVGWTSNSSTERR